MPNWCLSSITIVSTQGRNLKQWMDELYEETINWLKYTPPFTDEDLDDLDAVGNTFDEDHFDREKFSLYYCCKPPPQMSNYEWRMENFGVDWDIVEEDQYINVQVDKIHILIDTFPASPFEAFRQLTERFSDIHVFIKYEEQSMNYGGYATIENGKIEKDEYTYRDYAIKECEKNNPGATVLELDEKDYKENLERLNDMGVQYKVSEQLENIIAVYSEKDAVLAKLAAV
jgi:hypothetical protein